MAIRKASARKTAAKSAGARKTARRKPAAKSTVRKSTVRRPAAKSAVRKPAVRKAAAKRPKRAPNAGLLKPMQPSQDLAAVVGARPMPRTEATKRIWDYIKKNGLQDAKNRRQINADDRLQRVFGGRRQVSMFEMTKLVSNHLKST